MISLISVSLLLNKFKIVQESSTFYRGQICSFCSIKLKNLCFGTIVYIDTLFLINLLILFNKIISFSNYMYWFDCHTNAPYDNYL